MTISRSINRIFLRVLLSYLLVLSLPLFFVGIIYNTAGNSIRATIIQTNQALLEQSMKAIEDKYSNLRKAAMNFARQRELLDFILSDSDDISFIAKSIELKQQIDDIQSNNDMIDKIYIYSDHNKLFYSESGLANLTQFTGQYYQSANVNQYNLPLLMSDSHMGRFLALSRILQPATLKDQSSSSNPMVTKDEITFIQTLPIALSKQFDGALIVLLNANSITQLLNNSVLQDGGSIAVLDETGAKLIEVLGKTKSNSHYDISFGSTLSGQYQAGVGIVAKVISPTTKWTYLASVPEKTVLGPLNSVGQWVLLLAVAMFATGALISIILARTNSTPLNKILNTVYGRSVAGSVKEDRSNFNTVVDAVSQLVAANQQLNTTLSEQNNLMTYSFLNRLFASGYSDNEEINAYLRKLGLDLGDTGFYVVHIRLFSSGSGKFGTDLMNSLNYAYETIVKEAIGFACGKAVVHKQDIANILLLCNCAYPDMTDEVRNQKIEESLSSLFSRLSEKAGICLHMAVGGYYAALKDATLSAREARRALSAFDLANDQPLLAWYDDRQNRDSSQHPYSVVFEQHLLNQIVIGNGTKVRELLELFYTNNIIKRKWSYKTLELFKHELTSTLVRAIQESGSLSAGSAVIETVNFDDPIDVFFANVTNAALELCRLNAEPVPASTDSSIGDLLISYIHQNITDPDLSYSVACEHFKISRYHLNKYLQEKTGIGFTGYLENLRMETAVKLLEESKLSIHDISVKTGYLNDKTFRRAFKRSFGYSPRDRRNAEPSLPGL